VIHISNGIRTASVRITKHFGRDRQLEVKIGWDVGGEKLSPVLPLIDNGADVCLVKKGFIQKRFFSISQASFAPDWCQRAVGKGGTRKSSWY